MPGSALAAAGGQTASVLIELGAGLLLLALAARLAARLQTSAVPFYLVIGVAIGLSPWPAQIGDDTIETGAAIGLVLLLFSIGLEYTGEELLATLRRDRLVGVVDAAANALPALAVGLLMGLGAAGALALAGVAWISSSGIVARTLDDLGRLGNRETPVVLSVLVIEDLAMAVYLPLLTVMLVGGTLLAALESLALAAAVLGVVLLVALRGAHHAARMLDTERAEALVLSVLGVTLLVAGLAEQAKVSAAVGAFLVGIALSGSVAERSRADLAPVRDLFAAGFFVFFGLQIELAGLADVWPWVAVLAALGVAGKLATGWFGAARDGVAIPGRLRAGTVLVARGEFSIVVAALAVAAGADSRIATVAAAYVLVLALVSAVLTRSADRLAARLVTLHAVRR